MQLQCCSMDKKQQENFEQFPDIGGTSIDPVFVKILTDCAGTDESVDIEWIILCRRLTEEEQARLQKAKTPEEVRELCYLVKEINEPEVYEVDFRMR